MTRLSARHWVMLGMAGSALTLGAGFFFQHVIGLAPCVLCIWQRWPHAAAVVLGALSLWRRGLFAACAAAGLVAGAGIAGYHVGVEQHWWAGPSACAGPDFGKLTPQQLLEALRATPVVRCDEIPWSLFGISMAGWNLLLSLGLAAVFGMAQAAPRQASSSASQ
jgi:disulfide bond formation protein DsbB